MVGASSQSIAQAPAGSGAGADFRLFLQDELLRRAAKNPKFSLRAFARVLQIEPSALSKILNGKRRVSPAMFKKFATRLGLAPDDVARFDAVRYESAAPSPAASPITLQTLTQDAFQVIADWYHYAILELTRTRGFQSKAVWIAKALGISGSQASFAIERLTRLGMLSLRADGTLVEAPGHHTTIGNDYTVAAFRRLQRQILEQALVALESLPFERRSQTSMTMAVDSRKLPQAKERIKKFQRELCEFLQSDPSSCDEVFQLSVALFPVTGTRSAE